MKKNSSKNSSPPASGSLRLKALRRQAEEHLRLQNERLGDLSKKDIEKLVNELGTYQIELEMQNEELRLAQEELEKSRSQYVNLYDFAPVGYYTFDQNGVILDVNLAGAALLWKEKTFLINKPFSLFIHKDDQDTFFLHRRKVFETDLRQTCEIRLKSESSSEIYTRLESIPDRDVQGNLTRIRSAVSNITEVKMAEKAVAEEEARYRTIFEGANDGILSYDIESDKFLFANKRMSQLTGYPEEELLKLHVKDLHPPADLPHVLEQFRKAASGKIKEVKTIPLLRKDRSVIYCDISSSFSNINEKSILLGFFRDVTEQITAEKRMKHLASFPQLNPNPVMETDVSGKITYFNPGIQKILEGLGMDKNDVNVFLPADFSDILHELEKKEEATFYREILVKDRIFSSTVHIAPQFNVVRIYSYDITERYRAEESLRKSEEALRTAYVRYFSFIAVTGQIGWTTNPAGEVVEDLPEWRNYTGQSFEDIKGWGWSKALHPDDLSYTAETWEKSVREKSKYEVEYRIRRHDGIYRLFLARGTPVFKEDGTVLEWVGTCIDITDRKEAENQIRTALEEKEILLREIHHRVKNNMTVIFSMLKLQSKHVKDDRDRVLFDNSMARIKSMALIHEKLYRSKNMAEVNFGDYIKELAGSIFMSYRIPSGRIRLKTDVGNVSFGIDTAIPCGLIINELLSNSMKYAFPDGASGELSVSLHEISESRTVDAGSHPASEIELIVGDNGIGMPEKIDISTSDSLGLNLVKAFVKQLHGKIEMSRENGTEFRIRFEKQTSGEKNR